MKDMKTDQRCIDPAAQRVFDIMQPRVTAEELQRIVDAYFLACDAHSEQKRKTGEPYIIHPIAVATIAAEELELDANTVCAAFLHDVVEDTAYTLDDIRERFGDDVAFLVDAVTKRKKTEYVSSKQVDNFQQIVASVNYDVRALLLKLSDRLHNMRTLDSMRPDKQMKIAGETDFFYAPLAGRLGLFFVKSELENLSFRFRCPKDYETVAARLEEDRARTACDLTDFCDRISDILRQNRIKARVEVRYRKPYSIWRDMKERGCDFQHVEFKHFVRVIYEPSSNWCDEKTAEKNTAVYIYSILSSCFTEKNGSVVNFIDHPKDNGYQSFHVRLLNPVGVWEELHIASERMHRDSLLGCVVERGESWLERFRNLLRDIADNGAGYLFMDDLDSTLYNEDIIAFTPKGKGIILPKGATALDFAFELHSEIGVHAQYARVNGRLCPISTELRRGDCVFIGTNERVDPVPEWLQYAKAYRSRKILRELFKNADASQYRICENCRPIPGEEVVGFKNDDGTITVHTRHCPEAIKRASEMGDSIVTVDFKPDGVQLYPVSISITAIDRYHLLRDIIDCLVEEKQLSMDRLDTVTRQQIVTCIIDFAVHSYSELQGVMDRIAGIDGVEEVNRDRIN